MNFERLVARFEQVGHAFRCPLRVARIEYALPPLPMLRIYALPESGTSLHRIRRHADDFALALALDRFVVAQHAHYVTFTWYGAVGGEALTLDYALRYAPCQAGTLLLGLTPARSIVALDLCSSSVVHLVIAGSTGAGKSTALRVALLSALASASADELALWLVDPKGFELRAPFDLTELPHVRHYAAGPGESLRLLRAAREEMERRERVQTKTPLMLVVVDEMLSLDDYNDLTALVLLGRASGVHVIACAQLTTQASGVPRVLTVNFGARLVLRTGDAYASRALSGGQVSDAHLLRTPGDAYLVMGERVTRLRVFRDSRRVYEALLERPALVETTPSLPPPETLSEPTQQRLARWREAGKSVMRRAELASLWEVSSMTASSTLRELCAMGAAQRVGHGKYRLCD